MFPGPRQAILDWNGDEALTSGDGVEFGRYERRRLTAEAFTLVNCAIHRVVRFIAAKHGLRGT